MHENAPTRKIGTTISYMSANAHFNVTMKGRCASQIHKDGPATVNDQTEQKVSSSDGLGNNLSRYKSYEFKPLHTESSSKRFPEQTTFDTALNILQPGFMDTTNRGYAAKSVVASIAMKPADVRQNSFTRFANNQQYGTAKAQASIFSSELSMATISRSNESGPRSSQEKISGNEYIKRLLQAHRVVDELLKSRGLTSESEVSYLCNWRQKMKREQKIEESAVPDPAKSKNVESLDTSKTSQQQRCRSNASDSGLSMDADSESDPKLQEVNLQDFTFTNILPFKKQETTPVKSLKVNIVKIKKHKNVYLKVIIIRPQHCQLHMNVKSVPEEKKPTDKRTTKSVAMGNSKKRSNKRRQMAGGQVEGMKIISQTCTSVQVNEENSLTHNNKRLNQNHKTEIPTMLEKLTSTSNVESSTANSNEPGAGSKNDRIDMCCCFANEFCCTDKAAITLSISRCATLKQKNAIVSGKKFSDRKEEELKSKYSEGDSMNAILPTKTEKLSINMKMVPELQNIENASKIRAARKEDKVVESKKKTIRIKKDVVDLNKTEKCSKFPILIKESTSKLKAPEKGSSSVPKSCAKNTAQNQAPKTSTYIRQVTLSKNLCVTSKLLQSEATTTTILLRTHAINSMKLVMVKQMTDDKKYRHEEVLRGNDPSAMRSKGGHELKQTQKALQNYTTVTTNRRYSKTLRSITGHESSAMSEFERNEGIDIRQAREHLRHINFNRTTVRLQSNTSFAHRTSEGIVKLSANGVFSEKSPPAAATVKKANKKACEVKVDKSSKDPPIGRTHTTSIEKGNCGAGSTSERNSDILDRELINSYRRTKRIPKPQAKIPAWNVYDERKLGTGTTRNPPNLRYGTLSTTTPVPCFIRARTPAPIDVAATLSTPPPAVAVLRHVSVNHLPVMTSRAKNILSNDSDITSLQQHTSSSQFGVTLKRVDLATVQKSKPHGAITQSAPKEPWVPKWRRIQRTEEEEEAERISVVEMNKHAYGSDGDEQEERQMTTIQLSSKIATQKGMTEAEKAMMVAKRRQIDDETAKLQEYEEKRRVEREQEEEELRKLKEKKERRKLEREEEERQFQERLRQEEARRKQEEDERKAKMEAEKRKKEDEKRKRQQMLSSPFMNTVPGQTGRNFIIPQKSDKTNKFGNIVQAKHEMSMTKEQQEEAKGNYLASVRHTIEFEKTAPAELREKIRQLHQRICKLEADKYDLEKRHERQEYDLRELNERQRQVARNKALKKGLDAADTNSRHPRCATSSSKDATLAVSSIPTTTKPEMTAYTSVQIMIMRSCTGQNLKTANKRRVDQRHQTNLSINLRTKSTNNSRNNDKHSMQATQPYNNALNCKYLVCNGDSEKSSQVIVKPGAKQLEMKDIEHESGKK